MGEVITFYSYKGGTGRTMALANIACLLGMDQLGPVLVVDWDLEAPGLHRFFRPYLSSSFAQRQGTTFEHHPGLMELLWELESAGNSPDKVRATLDRDRLAQFIVTTDVAGVDFMKAGRFDEEYPARVSSLDWEGLFRRVPSVFREMAQALASHYRYVLIDSRTGLSDASGICTALLPETVVFVFTPNLQSLTGLRDLVRRASRYRRESDDLRPLVAFPLPSRVELTAEALRDRWRFGDPDRTRDESASDATGEEDVQPGYQPFFEGLFREVYDLPECDLGPYFDEVQIQHVAEYAYGEEIAVLTERRRDRLSLTRSYRNFTDRLVNRTAPWSTEEERTAPYDPEREGAERIEYLESQLRLQRRLMASDRRALAFGGLILWAVLVGMGVFQALSPQAGALIVLWLILASSLFFAGLVLGPRFRRVQNGNRRLGELRRALAEESAMRRPP